jgi:hypothetical protein
MFSLRELSSTYPEQLWLKLSVELQEKAWQRSQRHSNATARCNAYLNDLCMNTFIPWLKAWLEEEQPAEQTSTFQPSCISIFPESSLPSLWEFVNGSVIKLGKIRLALIPSESNDLEEFCIPQEWVDLPSWRADYYLAVQVSVDNQNESWMRLWGYVTHENLKKKGIYDESDRTYYIAQQHLAEDLTMMLLEPEPALNKQIQVESVSNLSKEIASNLLEKLGKSSVYFPRLAVSFEQWAALLANEQWRQELYERRLGQFVAAAAHKQTSINLGQWFQEVFEAGWQSLDTLLNTGSENLAFSFRQGRRSVTEVRKVFVEGIKLIDLGMELENQSVALLVGLAPETEQRVGIRVQLYPAGGQTYLPSNIKLILLSQSGATLQEYKARTQDSLIQLKRFTCPMGKCFSVKVALDDFSITEDFVIEPLAGREL